MHSVGESRFELMDSNSPKLPEITLKGLVHAFIVNQPDSFDLAEIQPGDGLNAICTDISEGTGGLFVKGKCQPILLARSINQQMQIIWVTPDREALEFALAPQTIERLTTPKQ